MQALGIVANSMPSLLSRRTNAEASFDMEISFQLSDGGSSAGESTSSSSSSSSSKASLSSSNHTMTKCSSEEWHVAVYTRNVRRDFALAEKLHEELNGRSNEQNYTSNTHDLSSKGAQTAINLTTDTIGTDTRDIYCEIPAMESMESDEIPAYESDGETDSQYTQTISSIVTLQSPLFSIEEEPAEQDWDEAQRHFDQELKKADSSFTDSDSIVTTRETTRSPPGTEFGVNGEESFEALCLRAESEFLECEQAPPMGALNCKHGKTTACQKSGETTVSPPGTELGVDDEESFEALCLRAESEFLEHEQASRMGASICKHGRTTACQKSVSAFQVREQVPLIGESNRKHGKAALACGCFGIECLRSESECLQHNELSNLLSYFEFECLRAESPTSCCFNLDCY